MPYPLCLAHAGPAGQTHPVCFLWYHPLSSTREKATICKSCGWSSGKTWNAQAGGRRSECRTGAAAAPQFVPQLFDRPEFESHSAQTFGPPPPPTLRRRLLIYNMKEGNQHRAAVGNRCGSSSRPGPAVQMTMPASRPGSLYVSPRAGQNLHWGMLASRGRILSPFSHFALRLAASCPCALRQPPPPPRVSPDSVPSQRPQYLTPRSHNVPPQMGLRLRQKGSPSSDAAMSPIPKAYGSSAELRTTEVWCCGVIQRGACLTAACGANKEPRSRGIRSDGATGQGGYWQPAMAPLQPLNTPLRPLNATLQQFK